MAQLVGTLFDVAVWAPALDKYGAIAQLSLGLYSLDGELACGLRPATPMCAILGERGYDPGLFADCARECLGQPPDDRPPVIVTKAPGLAVVGVSLLLDGRIVGALVAGYALVHFCESVAVSRLARESGTPFEDLWSVARRQKPISTRRLILHGEFLQLLGDSLLGESDLRRRQSEETAVQLRHLATHDPLTDLPNRVLLADRLSRSLALARRHKRRLAVLFLDIDHFKHINDSLGHVVGDELLRAVGRALVESVRASDTVGRYGGDEFVVVLSEVEHRQAAHLATQKILNAIRRPHQLSGSALHVTASVGISVFPDDGEEAEALLTRADMALYSAKHVGRDCHHFFEPALQVRVLERQSVEAGLRGALERREFELLYQPTMNLRTGRIVGAEALIRWRHPTRGLIEPAQFVPIAEDCGLIRPIGIWVVQEACRQARAWQTAGLPPITVSVNISAIEFRSDGFLNRLVEILQETGLDPQYLELEFTERVLMAHVDTTVAVLHKLKMLGLQLAIDDFGTGWSSLAYLRHFPIDALKIDQSFVHEITAGATVSPIVTGVIKLGRSLNHRVIAEGVETSDQLAFLQAEDCSEGQGYYFSPPLTTPLFAQVLEAGMIPS